MDESGGQETAETSEKKVSETAKAPSDPRQKTADTVPPPAKITVVRSKRSYSDLTPANPAEPTMAVEKPVAAAAALEPEEDQTRTVLTSSMQAVSPQSGTSHSGPAMTPEIRVTGQNLRTSQQGLRPILTDLPPERPAGSKIELPVPDQPLPPPQAPPQFLGDQGHTRPSDNSLDRSQFGTASKHGGAPIALLTNVNRKKVKTPSKFQPAFEFIKSNVITCALTLSMVLLAALLFINKDPKTENVGNLDLSILTTGQTLEEVNQLLNAKKYEAALSLCDNVIHKDTKFAEAYHARGQVYMAMHRFREAVDDFTTAESYNRRSVDIHIDRAAALYHTQEFDKAKREYEEILAAEPDNAPAFFGKGLAEENLGMTTEALADFRRTLEKRSDYAAAHEEMGNIHFAKGELKAAYEDYTSAIKIAPTISRFYFNRANTLKKDHQPKRAIADYCKAIQLDPTRPEFFNNRGLLYLENDEPAKAMTDFSSAVDLDPNYTIAKHNLTLAQERVRR